jgi:uncharacterized glyoxalase superfamily protein PhnB
MENKKVIPVLRIFDYNKAIEFYVDWLGFQIDWEHHFDSNSPAYLQITRDFITLHLSEHHGDCSPGAKVFIEYPDLKSYHQKLLAKSYKYNRPGLEKAFYGAWTMEVTDPFANRLLFNERTED